QALLFALRDRVLAGTGSACSSQVGQASPVLRAMGVPGVQAHQAVRFSLGHTTTDDEVECAATAVIAAARSLRRISGLVSDARGESGDADSPRIGPADADALPPAPISPEADRDLWPPALCETFDAAL